MPDLSRESGPIDVDALLAAGERAEQRAEKAEADAERLAEALRTICDIGETRDVEVARKALAQYGRERA